MIACVNCAYTVAAPVIGVIAVVGGLVIGCFKCFCLKLKKKSNCNCDCHQKENE